MSPASSPNRFVDQSYIESLMEEITLFVGQLTVDIDIVVHRQIDQFFYMEKKEELRTLNERIEELQARIILMQTQRDLCHRQVKEQLKIDSEWLREYRKQSRGE